MKLASFLAAFVAALALTLAALVPLAHADAPVFKVYAGANGAWLQGPDTAFPTDFEGGGAASASLSPHLSAVGQVFYGFSHSYIRYAGGLRVTTTDVNNPNFNTFLGVRYVGGSTAAFRPSEWAPDAGFGWRPSPANWPRLTVTGDAGYGVTSARALFTIGLRYEIPLQ